MDLNSRNSPVQTCGICSAISTPWPRKPGAVIRSLQKRRIPEKTLFAFAVVGGALGGTLGMYGFRHKTLHKTFAIGFPLLAIVQIAAVVFLVIKFA